MRYTHFLPCPAASTVAIVTIVDINVGHLIPEILGANDLTLSADPLKGVVQALTGLIDALIRTAFRHQSSRGFNPVLEQHISFCTGTRYEGRWN